MTTRALNALLSALGLMRVSEHEEEMFRIECQAAEALNEVEHLKAELRAADNLASGWEAKFNLAATDLADQAEELTGARQAVGYWKREATDARNEANELRPDALLWRAARQKRRKGKAP